MRTKTLVKLLVGLIALISAHRVLAQNWTEKPDINPSVNFNGVYFTSDQTGYAVGTGGAIYKTTDGGLTWSSQTSGTSNELKDVFFVTNQIGYAAGASGVILRTANGGTGWTTVATGISGLGSVTFNEISFPNNNVGYFAGTGGTVVKTTDGGTTWESVTSGTSSDLLSVFFTTNQIGFISAGSGLIRKTTNGGTNWTTLTISTTEAINDMFFIDSSTGYLACTAGEVWKTTDGGTSWTKFDYTNGLGSLDNFNIYFSDGSNGFVTTGTIYQYVTPNGGTNWINFQLSISDVINDIHLSSATTGYMVGSNGLLLKYQSPAEPEYQATNLSFSELYSTSMRVSFTESVDIPTGYLVIMKEGSYPTTDPLDGLTYNVDDTWGTSDGKVVHNGAAAFFNLSSLTASTGYYFKVYAYNGSGSAINYKVSSPLSGYQTTYNSGTPWTSLTNDTYWYPADVHFYDANAGGVGGGYGLTSTANGGQNFTPGGANGDSYGGIFFTSATVGYAVGGNGAAQVIMRTVNGGSTWVDQVRALGNILSDVWFTNSITGYSVGGSGTIIRTTNGISWSSITSPTSDDLSGIHFPSSAVGYAVGNNGTAIKTTNSGSNWSLLITPTSNWLTDVFFTDANTGFAVGDLGTIIKTTDGGSSWTTLTSGTTNRLSAVHFVSSSIGYAVGLAGTILKTLDGGTTWYAFTEGADLTTDFYGVHFPSQHTGYAVGYAGTDTKIFKFQSAPQPVSQPTSLQFSSITQSSVAVSFTAATGNPSGYIAVRKSGSAPTTIPLDGIEYSVGQTLGDGTIAYFGSGTSFGESGLSPGTTYYYKIYSYNYSGDAGSANYLRTSPLSGNTLTTLLPPTSSAATSIGSTGFTANWTSVSGATSYRLDLSTDGFASFVSGYNNVTVGTNSLAVTGLQSGTSYSYRVRAINASGASTNSDAINTTTIPAAPTLTSSTLTSTTGFTANWSPSVGASGYFADVSTSSGFSSFVTGYNNLSVSTTQLSITGLSSGTTYYFRIRAINSTGTSGNSSTGNTITLCVAPTASAATSLTASSFNANWTAATGAADYRIDVSSDPAFSFIVGSYNNQTVAGTSLSISGLTTGTTYYYRVRASNASGSSASSNVVSALTYPTAPTANDALSVSTTTFTASWNTVPTATGYLLDVSTLNTFSSFVTGYNGASVAATSTAVTVPSAGTTYYYRVRASNGSGTSSNSNTTSVLTKPAAPVAAAATSVMASSFTANWNAVSPVPSEYIIDVSSDNFVSNIPGYDNLSVSNSANSVSVTSLTAGTTYKYRVRSSNATGVSANSGTISVTIVPPGPVATSATSQSTTTFNATWQATSGASSYRLDVSLLNDFSSFVSGFNDLTVNSTSQSVTGLTSGTGYFYRVRAVNTSGTSINSNVVETITLCASPVANASTSVSATGFTASWSSPTGVGDFRIDVSTVNTFSSFVSGYSNLTVFGTSLPVTGLASGLTYYYRVRASNASGSSANSNVVTTLVKTSPPNSTAATAVTTTGFTANWDAVSGSTGYKLDVSINDFISNLTDYSDLSVSGTSQTVTGLNPGTTYKYRVRAVNSTGASDNSNITATITVPPAPVAASPTSVTTTSFTASWNTTSGIPAYYLDISTDGSFNSYLTGYNDFSTSTGSQTITGLNSGTTYYYRVRAANVSGTSANSNVITAITLPMDPTAGAASTVTSTGFTANWSSVLGVTEYRIDVSTDNNFSFYVGSYSNQQVAGTSLAVTGLSPGTLYYYRVRSANLSGSSSNSSAISVLTLPAAPVANDATFITTNTFTASWNTVSTATGYFIDVSTASNFSSLVVNYDNASVTSNSIVVTVPVEGTTYYYRVRAISSAGLSANSNTISTLLKPPSPLANAASSITGESFTASWLAAAGATGYYLDVSSNNFSTFIAPYDNFLLAGTSINITGLSAGTSYQYRVRSYNMAGSSPSSSVISTITIPPAPVTINSTSFTTTSFTANWMPSSGAVDYRIDVSYDLTFASGTFVAEFNDLTVAGTSASVTGLTPGTIYYYRVRAVNTSGTSPNSNVTSSTNIPPPPSGLFPSAISTTGFTVNWGNTPGALSYFLDVSTTNFNSFVNAYNDLSVSGTSLILSGLTPGTPYQFRVRATNASGTSPNSNTIFVETLPDEPFSAPTDLSFTAITTTGIGIAYTPPSGGAAGYLVLRRSGSAPTGLPVDGVIYNLGTALGDGTVAYAGSATSFTESGLTAGTTYHYAIFAYNGTGITTNYLSTDQLNGSQITVSDAPVAAAATSITQNSFIANWTAATGASNYSADVSADDFQTFATGHENQATGNVTTYLIDGLASGKNYKYRVRAVNGGGASANSAGISVLTIPDTPTSLTASTITSTSFIVTWTAVTGQDNYLVDLSTDSNFGILIVNGASVTGPTITLSGLASSTAYNVRVRSANASGASPNSEVLTVTTLAGGGVTALDVSLQATSSLNIKSSSIVVTAKVTGGSDPKTVKFHIRKLTENNFSVHTASLRSGETDVYEYTVTPEMVDDLGAEYYFSATDVNSMSDESSKNYIYQTIDVNTNKVVPFAGATFTGTVASYQMFSIPYVLADKNIDNLFEPALNGFSNTRWRLLHYLPDATGESGKYVEYPDGLKTIDLGLGYWFNTVEEDFQIKLSDAQVNAVTPSSPFQITFQKGWNQIGDPYPFNVDWNTIQDANPSAGLNSIWLFEEGAFVKKTVLASWKGAFVFSDNGGVVSFPLTAKTSSPGRQESEEDLDFSAGEWQLPLTVQAGELTTFFSTGMRVAASHSKDRFDEITIPRFFDYLEMSSYHPEFFAPDFSTDIVPVGNEHSWTFTLNTSTDTRTGLISWDPEHLSSLASNILLLDVHNQVLVNMKTTGRYEFGIKSGQQFKIMLRDGEFRPGAIPLGSAYPNPFEKDVSIPLFLDGNHSSVQVQIFNSLGQPICAIGRQFSRPGFFEVTWDGSSPNHAAPSEGMLFYQVTVNGVPAQLKRLVRSNH